MKTRQYLRYMLSALILCLAMMIHSQIVLAETYDGDTLIYENEHKAVTMINSETKEKEVTYLTPYMGWSIIPITVQHTGMLYLEADFSSASCTPGDLYLLYQYESMGPKDLNWYDLDTYTREVFYDVKSGSTVKSTNGMPVAKGQTCYVLIFNPAQYDPIETDEYFDLQVDLSVNVYTTQERTLPQGSKTWTIASGMNQKNLTSATYFKVKPDRSGVMKVSLKEFGYANTEGTVTLYDGNKKKISNAVTYASKSKNTVKFGVKKGKTYYLKVTETKGTKKQAYKFGVKYSMSSATDRALGSKSSAKGLYRKAKSATKTLFVAENKNAVDYYNFKVTTPRKTKISVNCEEMTSGYVTVKLYHSSGKLIKEKKVNGGKEGYILTSSKLKKGTYYVKIMKSKMTSGIYSVQWTY